MQTRTLGRTGLTISELSLGGAAIGQQYGPVTAAEVEDTVNCAIDAGINFIDTAAYYGEGVSEEILGQALSNGLREKILLGTKAGRLKMSTFDFTPKGMRDCFEKSLQRLRTDRVDILIAHDIEFADDFESVMTDTAEVLHQFKAEGKARFVGMSGLPLAALKQAIERCKLDVIITYCHFHLQNQTLLTDLLPVAEAHGVGVLNGSPLAMGLHTNQGPQWWHPGDDEIKKTCATAAKYCQDRGKDISALGMQFALSEPRIHSTITGTARRVELERNLAAIAQPIDETLLKEVQAILQPVMNRSWPSGHFPAPQ
jgi:L-galactose dehydrogenase